MDPPIICQALCDFTAIEGDGSMKLTRIDKGEILNLTYFEHTGTWQLRTEDGRTVELLYTERKQWLKVIYNESRRLGT